MKVTIITDTTRTNIDMTPRTFSIIPAKGDKGNKGDAGNGIASIEKTGSSGLLDTYTISYTNGDTATFQVKNGEDGTIENLSVEAQTLPAGSDASASYEDNTLTLGIPVGADGVSPVVAISTITGGHRITVTDTGGTHTFDVMDGEDGTDGVGVPMGGTTGQALVKASGTDYDTEWGDAGSGVPSGGTTGQALVKASNADGDVEWGNMPRGIPSGGSTGQVLSKSSGTDYAVGWGTPRYIPSGGTAGQALVKSSGTDYDVAWGSVSGGGSAWDVDMALSSWTLSTFSAAAVNAGAPSGGACYTATYTDNNSPITEMYRFIPSHAAGYSGAVYATPINHGVRVETAVQPASGSHLAGTLVPTDFYYMDGVAAAFNADALTQDFSSLTALPQAPATTDLLAIRSGNETYKIACKDFAKIPAENISWSDFINTTSYINTEGSWVKKRGNEIFGYIITPSMNRTVGQGIGTINNDYLPKSHNVICGTTSGGVLIPFWFRSDGGIINLTAVSNTIVLFSFHYVLPDF